MRTIGLIGGMSWESTVPYYQHINRLTAQRLGPLHSARLVLYSVDFSDIEAMQRSARWDEAGALLADAARRVQAAGAEFLVLCTNTMHKVADAIEAAVDIPLLHIVDPTGSAIRAVGLRRVGLLGTRYTMEDPFYRDCLAQRFGIEAIVPEAAERARVHEVIYEELCRGRVLASSREEYLGIAAALAARGARGIILGCTEVGMLIGQGDTAIPLFDTTFLHAQAAVTWAIEGPESQGGKR
jgi:aspartate racemase